ncbi:MAG TPA: hypothetical protein VD907_00475 [Verrucomicrobiae bacterium]|nr:hypothetical protein [Verrucomicrobiae bacterium]
MGDSFVAVNQLSKLSPGQELQRGGDRYQVHRIVNSGVNCLVVAGNTERQIFILQVGSRIIELTFAGTGVWSKDGFLYERKRYTSKVEVIDLGEVAVQEFPTF